MGSKTENLTKMKEAKDREAAKKMAEKQKRDVAISYVEDIKKKGIKYVAIRIRDGFIGKELSEDGRVLQPYRTKPRGTMIAFKNPKNENELKIGISYLNNELDKDIPIAGVAEAFKYAFEENDHTMVFSSSTENDKVKVFGYANNNTFNLMSKNDKDLLNFFRIRALCYFYPELYSHSRGTEKIEYPNYEKNHKNRIRVLGK